MRSITVTFIFLLHTVAVLAQHDSIPHQNALTDSIWQIGEIEITAPRKIPLLQTDAAGQWNISPEAMKRIPHFLGDTDPMKVIQLLPGIANGGELNGGIYIRGSEPGHNLVTLDGATIYNPSHLLGLFSVFNNDHFSAFSLQKSYIPSSKGGRLAGYLEMQPRDSILTRAELSGNVGILASRATAGIPLTRKSTVYVSARATYINPIIQLMEKGMADNTRLRYDFQDYNLTYTYHPTARNRIVLNGYVGRDLMTVKEHQYQADSRLQWINAVGSARWQHRFRQGSSMTHRLYASYYHTILEAKQNTLSIALPSHITEGGYKGEMSFRLGDTRLQAGAEASIYRLSPQYPETRNVFEGINRNRPQAFRTVTFGVFAEAEHRLGNMTLHAGLRYDGSRQHAYRAGHLDPRLQAVYHLKRKGKIYASFVTAHQYINQINVSTVGFPLDFWMPATQALPEQRACTWNIGYSQPLPSGTYEFSAEAYYRTLNNQTVFNGGLYDMLTQQYRIEDYVVTGQGRNYGLELFVKKNRGRWNGWISYTLAWADRKFPTLRQQEWFPAKYDRRHNLNATLCLTLNDRWDFSAVYIYASGNAVTLPVALNLIGENAVCIYEPYHSSRMPSYQRMDLSANFHFGYKHNQSLNASLYNVLKRHNPVFIQVGVKPADDGTSLQIKKRNMALYSLLPSLSYTFKF